MSAIHGALSKYAEFSNSWEAQLKEVEGRVVGCDRCLKDAIERESKLKDLIALHDSRDSWVIVIQELEAQKIKKDGMLAREWAHIAKVESQLAQIEDLLYLANEKIKTIEKEATSTAMQEVEYKKSDDFENDGSKSEQMLIWSGSPTTRTRWSKPT